MTQPWSLHERFTTAKPFPHVVDDGMWDDYRLERIEAEFPPPDDPRWRTYPGPKERGKCAGSREMWGPETTAWFNEMHAPPMIEMMESMTGIYPLSADDLGGGMHMTGQGGRLGMHTDFNVHPENGMERRINFLVFLNKNWDPAWGGVLELGQYGYDRVSVVPEFNRTVVFATSDQSWHGHPVPVIGDHLRKSLAVYYYTPKRPETARPHSTVWGEDR